MRLYRKKKKFVLWGKKERKKEYDRTKGRKMLRIRKQKDETLQEKEEICPLGKRKKERKKEYNKLKEGKC